MGVHLYNLVAQVFRTSANVVSFLIMQFREVNVEEDASSHSAPFVTQCSQFASTSPDKKQYWFWSCKKKIGFGPAAQ